MLNQLWPGTKISVAYAPEGYFSQTGEVISADSTGVSFNVSLANGLTTYAVPWNSVHNITVL